jgi:hypothetical protein
MKEERRSGLFSNYAYVNGSPLRNRIRLKMSESGQGADKSIIIAHQRAVSKNSLTIQSSVVLIKKKLKQNGSNAIISDGAKIILEKTSQRFGMITRMASSDSIQWKNISTGNTPVSPNLVYPEVAWLRATGKYLNQP